MFEQASRLKMRFDTSKGSVSTEDLWDMPLTSKVPGKSLDDLARLLNKSVKETAEESFVTQRSNTNTVLEAQFDIVKYIIGVKMAEAKERSTALAKKAEEQELLEIIATKEKAGLQDLSIEDLKARVASL